jgi:hypothetical protein
MGGEVGGDIIVCHQFVGERRRLNVHRFKRRSTSLDAVEIDPPLLLIVLILGLHSCMTYSWTLCEISHYVGCTLVCPTPTETRAKAGSSFGVFGCKQTITASLDMTDHSQVHRSVFRASQARGEVYKSGRLRPRTTRTYLLLCERPSSA